MGLLLRIITHCQQEEKEFVPEAMEVGFESSSSLKECRINYQLDCQAMFELEANFVLELTLKKKRLLSVLWLIIFQPDDCESFIAFLLLYDVKHRAVGIPKKKKPPSYLKGVFRDQNKNRCHANLTQTLFLVRPL